MVTKKTFNMEEEFADLDFHSVRLENRFVRTMETLYKQPGVSILEASKNKAEAKAIYRMLANENFDREKIIKVHHEATIRRMAGYGGTVLAVQDTTGINYNTHVKTKGIGYIGDKTLGLNIHSCLAVTTKGLVLGLLDQSGYSGSQPENETASHDAKNASTVDKKENALWLETLDRSMADIPETVKVITVCDLEGSMDELFAKAQSLRKPVLIRIVQNRMTVENKRILEEIRKTQCRWRIEVTIPRDRGNSIPERKTVLQLRYDRYPVKMPRILDKNKPLPKTIDLHIIYVKEENPVKEESPIEWFLATSEPVNSALDAYEYVGYYTRRWKTGRFHYALKSGCAIEKLQERSMDKTTTLVFMYSVITAMMLNTKYAGRLTSGTPGSPLLGEDEWKLLYIQ